MNATDRYGWPPGLEAHYLAGVTPALVALRRAFMADCRPLLLAWLAAMKLPAGSKSELRRSSVAREKAETAIREALASFASLVEAVGVAEQKGAQLWQEEATEGAEEAHQRLVDAHRQNRMPGMPGITPHRE